MRVTCKCGCDYDGDKYAHCPSCVDVKAVLGKLADRIEADDAADRLERVAERFERMSAATMSAADCMELDLPKLWKLAERVEAFIEEKRKNGK